MSGHELDYVHEAFKTNWIAPVGPNIEGFEHDLSKYLGHHSLVTALSSGTAAIHLGLIVLGVKPGDEVICQSQTFAASANPIVYLGAKPIFVDSERDTWNMCPEQLEIAIKDRISKGKTPKSIIAVHLYGMPYKVAELHRISTQYNIPILEDSAEALGSTYHGKACGTFGTLAIFSFNGNKIITTSGGGALISQDSDLIEQAKHLANQARDQAVAYLHSDIGYNYKMSNVLAGIGRGQMKVIDERVKQRRHNFDYYVNALGSIDGISFQNEPNGSLSNRWLTCIVLQSEALREGLRLTLEKHHIETKLLWKPMHQQPVFKDCPKYLNGVSDDLFKKGLCLPSGSNLTDADRERISSSITQYFKV
jgi:dTDP-4-amino-4,6-dideoxygalactose transaminase